MHNQTRNLFRTSQVVAAENDASVVNVNFLAIFPAINFKPSILEGRFEIIQIDTNGFAENSRFPQDMIG